MNRFRVITWIAIAAPIPYSVSRLLWAIGIPAGLDPVMAGFVKPSWLSFYILFLALLTECPGIWMHWYFLSMERTAPKSIPLIGGKRLNRWVVVSPLLFVIAILLFGMRQTGRWFVHGDLGYTTTGHYLSWWPNWGVWGAGAVFWLWGPALILAAAMYLVRAAGQTHRP